MDRGATEDARQLTLFDGPSGSNAGRPRRLALQGRLVEYRFERRARRTIGIRVDAEGLAVSAPLRAPWRDIEAFLRSSERWIAAKLAEWAHAGRPARLQGRSGETLPLFGEPVVLEVRQGPRAVAHDGAVLCVSHPDAGRTGAVREVLVRWLKQRALEALAPRAAEYAARLGRKAPPVAISNARSQWGVCMADGRLRLSWRLAHLAPPLGDYVVAHEVAHLVELNHSKRFWRVVEALYPEWRAARQAIEAAGAALPIL
ncbi:MAG TPA: SprT family zinc-dependent metalloprotease [Burkholderiales bacterium]|nr:SprT family zinc-dependent metalloprotease [Burkholderiales bacterium]